MGKGYNNYMCKKPFHPGSKANIKRAWMAEQKTENEKKKQDELKTQYDKEQDLYNNRALLSTESKEKLELNFMYEAPPGAKRERQKEDDEPEYKFEWQRRYNAPREDYAKGNADIKDQPFGIPVRNVRCIKCHKWGHINTDKECPLFSQASLSSMPTTSMDPMKLMQQMREDGYGLKENVLGHHINPKAANQQFLSSEESDPETEFLKSLSTKEKKKLLRKLKKLSHLQEKKSRESKKHAKKKKSFKSKRKHHHSDKKVSKSKRSSSSDSSEESSDSDEKKSKTSIKKKVHKRERFITPDSEDEKSKHLAKQKKKHKQVSSSSDSTDETTDSDDEKSTNKSQHKTFHKRKRSLSSESKNEQIKNSSKRKKHHKNDSSSSSDSSNESQISHRKKSKTMTKRPNSLKKNVHSLYPEFSDRESKIASDKRYKTKKSYKKD